MNTLDLERVVTEVDRSAPAKSPFLPGTNIQYAWDSTSLGYLKTCPRLYQYIMIDGWGENDTSVHLRFGIEYHQALQDYDVAKAEGIKHEDAIREALRALLERTYEWKVDETTKAGRYKNRRSVVRMVLDYLDHFADDPAVTHHLDDGRPAVELSFRFELDWGPESGENEKIEYEDGDDRKHRLGQQPYILSGHLDRVVNFCDNLYVMDRKTTTTTLGSYYFAQFEPNNQMTLYSLAAQVVLASPVKGVIIDGAQILADSSRFVRSFTYRTEDQLDEWVNDLRVLLAQSEAYAIANHWPMNDTACDKFGGCKFRDICSKSPGVRDRFLASSFTKLPLEERWNPLKPR